MLAPAPSEPPIAPARSVAAAGSPTPTPGMPLAVGQDWSGKYTCAQGETLAIVHIERVEGVRIHGAFLFRHPLSGAAGSYDVSGTYEPATGRISFEPGAWIERPDGYVSVGFTAIVGQRTMKGRVDHPDCGLVSLELTAHLEEVPPLESE